MGLVLQIDRASRRSASAEDAGYVVCDCGSAWFELCSIDSAGEKVYGAVSLNETGSVTGYTGTPHCIECGREKLP